MNPKERLIEDLQKTVSRYLDLYKSDSARLEAAKILCQLITKEEVKI